jgi:hypothetical protein
VLELASRVEFIALMKYGRNRPRLASRNHSILVLGFDIVPSDILHIIVVSISWTNDTVTKLTLERTSF